MAGPVIAAEQAPWPGRYALFSALRARDLVPPDVAWAVTELLTQVAATVDAIDSGELDGDSAVALRSWLDVIATKQRDLDELVTRTESTG